MLNFTFNNAAPIKIIAGPCQIESMDHTLEMAERIATICSEVGLRWVYKSSFDKANRSSIKGERGLGIDEGLKCLQKVQKDFEVPVITDIHHPEQASVVAEVVDIIQIPAFLCRQTDLIKAVSKTNKIVNIKKGQFLAPWDVEGILSKTKGAKEVWITERGTSFGYNTLVTDFTGLDYMLNNIDADIVFDVTHSVQKPGGLGGSSGGNRAYVPGLARAGSALGIKNFFLEVHEDPDNAPSDGPNMLHLTDFKDIVRDIHEYSYIDSRKTKK